MNGQQSNTRWDAELFGPKLIGPDIRRSPGARAAERAENAKKAKSSEYAFKARQTRREEQMKAIAKARPLVDDKA